MLFSEIAIKKIDAVYEYFHVDENGLTEAGVLEARKRFGANQLKAGRVSWWRILVRQFKSPFLYLLLSATVLSFVMGEIVNGSIVIGFIVINALLGFAQEFHSERLLVFLSRYIKSETHVRRGGKEFLVENSEIVPGDIIIVEAGDILPADVRFIDTNALLVDEGSLTGESVPVAKVSGTARTPCKEITKAHAIGFSGTRVVSGKGIGIVFATGAMSEMGKIASLTLETRHQSGFEKGIARFSRFILRMILAILVILLIINIILKGGNIDVFELVLFSIALAVSVVPEALPVVTTIALSKGAARLAKNQVVVKRLSAVEDLGSIEVLCTDKTGTLTENKLTVAAVKATDPDKCLFLATLASSFLGGTKHEPNNSFDVACWEKLPLADREQLGKYHKINELPFDPTRRCNSVLVVKQAGAATLVVRGAPEAVFARCTRLSPAHKKQLTKWVAEQGKAGHRTIALAEKKMSRALTVYGEKEEHGLTLVGLVSFVDPIKPTTKSAVTQAGLLGVQVKILTGDGPEVAGAVAVAIGLINSAGSVITGEEFEKLSEEKQLEAVERYSVFARVSPQQKYRVIELLQKSKEVGFLGEGINDAPALKIANVGIVVKGASDIAREAADIVLLNNSLGVIVAGIREGREIFANIIKYIRITLISSFGNFYSVATASLILPYLPMLPVQILILNLLTDFPMIAIATDRVDGFELKRPRSYNVRSIIFVAIVLGFISTLFDFIFFAIFYHAVPGILQTSWFIGSVMTELVLIFSARTRFFFARSKFPSLSLIGLSLAAAAAAVALPFTGMGQHIFQFIRPEFVNLKVIGLILLGYFISTESIKILYYRLATPKT